jgi:hypothetical protein
MKFIQNPNVLLRHVVILLSKIHRPQDFVVGPDLEENKSLGTAFGHIIYIAKNLFDFKLNAVIWNF